MRLTERQREQLDRRVNRRSPYTERVPGRRERLRYDLEVTRRNVLIQLDQLLLLIAIGLLIGYMIGRLIT